MCNVCVVVSDTHHMSVVIYFHTDHALTLMSDTRFLTCFVVDASLLEVFRVSGSACVAFATNFYPFGIAFLSFLPIPHFSF